MVRKPGQKPSVGSSSSGKARKEKNKTDPKTPMQRVLVLGPTGKRRFEWRPW
jgi:hypothetical protein